ncbi:hypothetical protein VP01_558g2 [Puccinia sorghi]|uniref:Uncharacterized protein n=1 Tax=Puccinia sorghi TaxID=27349 RepID=A0A0L6UJ61_9BASI|nr:hypothetical protein VP01_558g2 [Puccinia sorghi]
MFYMFFDCLISIFSTGPYPLFKPNVFFTSLITYFHITCKEVALKYKGTFVPGLCCLLARKNTLISHIPPIPPHFTVVTLVSPNFRVFLQISQFFPQVSQFFPPYTHFFSLITTWFLIILTFILISSPPPISCFFFQFNDLFPLLSQLFPIIISIYNSSYLLEFRYITCKKVSLHKGAFFFSQPQIFPPMYTSFSLHVYNLFYFHILKIGVSLKIDMKVNVQRGLYNKVFLFFIYLVELFSILSFSSFKLVFLFDNPNPTQISVHLKPAQEISTNLKPLINENNIQGINYFSKNKTIRTVERQGAIDRNYPEPYETPKEYVGFKQILDATAGIMNFPCCMCHYLSMNLIFPCKAKLVRNVYQNKKRGDRSRSKGTCKSKPRECRRLGEEEGTSALADFLSKNVAAGQDASRCADELAAKTNKLVGSSRVVYVVSGAACVCRRRLRFSTRLCWIDVLYLFSACSILRCMNDAEHLNQSLDQHEDKINDCQDLKFLTGFLCGSVRHCRSRGVKTHVVLALVVERGNKKQGWSSSLRSLTYLSKTGRWSRFLPCKLPIANESLPSQKWARLLGRQTTRKCVNVDKKIIRSFQKNRDCYVGKLLNDFLHVNNILVEELKRHKSDVEGAMQGSSGSSSPTPLQISSGVAEAPLRRSNWRGMAVSMRNFIFSWIVWTTVHVNLDACKQQHSNLLQEYYELTGIQGSVSNLLNNRKKEKKFSLGFSSWIPSTLVA